MDRIHPESLKTLEQLIDLHGYDRIIKAVTDIAIRKRKLVQLNIPRTAKERASKEMKSDLRKIVIAFHTEDGDE